MKRQDKGLVSEAQVDEVRAGLSELKRREQALTEREAQRSRELDQERINLEDLNRRLDALEREILLSSPRQREQGQSKAVEIVRCRGDSQFSRAKDQQHRESRYFDADGTDLINCSSPWNS